MVTFTDCKINIGLDIVAKRSDGYHDIETVMLPVPWGDVLEILLAKNDYATLTVLGNPVNCQPEDNLVMKAYRLLQHDFQLLPVDLILQKIVPDGAGLGGGSSDAAHCLRALNDFFTLNISDAALADYAARLGADCPLFIYDRPMYASGIGTQLTDVEINLSGYALVIAKPQGVNISTRQAYAGVKPRKPEVPLIELIHLPIDQWQGRVKNDFEESIFPLAPQIAAVKEIMLKNGALYSSMSGSGASVYGIFPNIEMARDTRDTTLTECDTFLCEF